jgi:hypothetical protein
MKLEIRRTEWITVKESAKKRLERADAEGLCVACMEKLDGSRVVRGCHERCYRATERAIKRGETSEKERVGEGKLLPSKSGGGKPSNPVTLELRAT